MISLPFVGFLGKPVRIGILVVLVILIVIWLRLLSLVLIGIGETSTVIILPLISTPVVSSEGIPTSDRRESGFGSFVGVLRNREAVLEFFALDIE